MCENCGCSELYNESSVHTHTGDHQHTDHGHPHSHDHAHDHSHSHGNVIDVNTDILMKNNLLAERNRGFFEAKGIRAVNLVSSPGSGKTTLLEKLILALKGRKKIYVIEGDQQTSNDADRIKSTGVDALQINTGNGCHLDAHMILHAVKTLEPENHSLLFIENVGNLVCPALFDLGEAQRIVIASTTEGEDKPLKYPNMFTSAHLCILNKTDLLPYLDFNSELFRNNLLQVNPEISLIELSSKTGEGFEKLVEVFSKD